MSEKKLKEWMTGNGITDAACMNVLHLNATQWLNRKHGRTQFSELEKDALSAFAGIPKDALFERGTK